MGCGQSKGGTVAHDRSANAHQAAGNTPAESGNPSSAVQATASNIISMPASSAKPPPGGKGATPKPGGAPTNLKDIPGTPTARGRILRPAVTLLSGAIYTGEWKDAQLDGHGELVYADASSYKGQFNQNTIQGNGTWEDSEGNSYTGEWKNNQINGEGTFYHADGSQYQGQWKNDLKHGKGTEVWSDGTSYTGTFAEGDKEGLGVTTYIDGSTYEGAFHEDEMCGEGVYKWPNGRVYKGQWKDSEMHGNGIFTWPPSTGEFSRYEGQYVNSVPEGTGLLLYNDGRKYKGNFKAGKRHGKGEEIWNSGIRKGEWEKGKLVRWTEQPKAEKEQGDRYLKPAYETTIFSAPQIYEKALQSEQAKHVQLKQGLLSNTHQPTENSRKK